MSIDGKVEGINDTPPPLLVNGVAWLGVAGPGTLLLLTFVGDSLRDAYDTRKS